MHICSAIVSRLTVLAPLGHPPHRTVTKFLHEVLPYINLLASLSFGARSLKEWSLERGCSTKTDPTLVRMASTVRTIIDADTAGYISKDELQHILGKLFGVEIKVYVRLPRIAFGIILT
jgi:hypothetical protein